MLTSNISQSSFTNLPYEICIEAFSYLDIEDLGKTAQVCKAWKDLSETNTLWKRFAKNSTPATLTFKEAVKKMEPVEIPFSKQKLYKSISKFFKRATESKASGNFKCNFSNWNNFSFTIVLRFPEEYGILEKIEKVAVFYLTGEKNQFMPNFILFGEGMQEEIGYDVEGRLPKDLIQESEFINFISCEAHKWKSNVLLYHAPSSATKVKEQCSIL